MSDQVAREVYLRAGLGRNVPRGTRPAILVVDLNCGSTDRECRHGMDLDAEVEATRRLLERARDAGLPVIFTTIAFESNLQDAGIWLTKLPSLSGFVLGSELVEIDPRLGRRVDETLIVKKGASACFGTSLVSMLVSQEVDTVILCGSTTSGCIRATAVDLMQYGFPTLVPQECVGDRAAAPHEANLFDIDAKYADVVTLDAVFEYVESLPHGEVAIPALGAAAE